MSLWGHLQDRYATQRPRKLLALDGGGIRGVLTLQVLIRMAEMLAEQSGQGVGCRACPMITGVRSGAMATSAARSGLSLA